MITVTEKISYDLEIDFQEIEEGRVGVIFEAIEKFCYENGLDDQLVWETDNGVRTDFCMSEWLVDVLKRKIQEAIK